MAPKSKEAKTASRKPTRKKTAPRVAPASRPTKQRVKPAAAGAEIETPSLAAAAQPVPASYTLVFEQTEEKFFATSLNKRVRDWSGTEQQLVEATLKLCPTLTLDILVHRGLQQICKTQLATALSAAAADAKWGIAGQADKRLDVAVQVVLDDNEVRRKEGKPVRKLTPNIVGDSAVPPVGPRTAKKYLLARGILGLTSLDPKSTS